MSLVNIILNTIMRNRAHKIKVPIGTAPSNIVNRSSYCQATTYILKYDDYIEYVNVPVSDKAEELT